MKKGNYLLLIVGAFLVFGSVSCTYYTNPEEPGFELPEPPEQGYVGSAKCAECHEGTHGSFSTTGHAYALSEVEGAAPSFPHTTVDFVPPHFTNGWNDVSYVIGGFAWRYLLTDAEGYVYTGDDAQFNFADDMAVPYRPEEAPGTIKFDCGKCHTTGWVSTEDGGVPSLVGFDGEYSEEGVQCEACHGMGALHANSPSSENIVINIEASSCGTCHSRNDGAEISASDGFIFNYSQYDEMSSTAHKDFSCVTCHDPHASVKHGETAGIVKNCTECHTDIKNPTHNGADCVMCHMPYASKSASSINKYVADIQTHIFKINTAADGEMFNEDGTIANGSSGVTMGYVCYQCHKDARGVGGTNSYRSLGELSDYATGYHD
jgi:hypothetical protein